MSDDRSERLRRRRNRSKETAQQGEQDKPGEQSESSEQAELAEQDEQSESSKLSEQAEPAEQDEQSEQSKTGEQDEQAGTGQQSVKDKRPSVYMYLPESQLQNLNTFVDDAQYHYKREYGVELEKNRHLYPLVIQHGLDQLDGTDAEGLRSKLQTLGLIK